MSNGPAALATTAGALVAGGATMLLAPGLVGRLWVGADGAGVRVLVRAVGARDLVLGVGLLASVRRDRPVRGWLEATLVAALVDGAASALAWRELPSAGRAFGVGASTAAAIGLAALLRREQ